MNNPILQLEEQAVGGHVVVDLVQNRLGGLDEHACRLAVGPCVTEAVYVMRRVALPDCAPSPASGRTGLVPHRRRL